MLRRLVTNATYAGKVEHRGILYKGEHEAIVEAPVWEEVNTEFRAGRRNGPPVVHVPQNALLAGVLQCAACKQPMLPTYTSKPGRRYCYYVCRSVRRNGWKACPTKSVPARLLEQSVLEQLRAAFVDDETRRRLGVSVRDVEVFERDPVGLIAALVKSVTFDGETGSVALDLRSKEAGRED